MAFPIVETARAWNRARRERRRTDSDLPHVLGVLGIMKNESLNVVEWVEHYLWQGAGRIYLIDNGSDDDTLARVQPFVDRGQVQVLSLTEKWKQTEHYWTAFRRFRIRSSCKWLLVADLDEFWFCKDGRTLVEALSAYDDYHVIYANWTFFGSGGYDRHPDSLRLRLTQRAPDLGPHECKKYLCRTRAITSARGLGVHKVTGACSSRTISDNTMFQINHYIIQSRQYFETVKMARGDVGSEAAEARRTWAYFERFDDLCTEEDRMLADQVAASRSG